MKWDKDRGRRRGQGGKMSMQDGRGMTCPLPPKRVSSASSWQVVPVLYLSSDLVGVCVVYLHPVLHFPPGGITYPWQVQDYERLAFLPQAVFTQCTEFPREGSSFKLVSMGMSHLLGLLPLLLCCSHSAYLSALSQYVTCIILIPGSASGKPMLGQKALKGK